MKIGFNKARWTQDAEGLWLSLKVEDPRSARKFCDSMMSGKRYEATLEKARKKRSLDANSYAWELIGKLADALRTTKDDVYLRMLKAYGQTGVVKIPDRIAGSVLREIKYWDLHEKLSPEKRASYYRVWIGSSNYDSWEMSVFIDGIISECQALGIETRTPEELAKIKARWADEI